MTDITQARTLYESRRDLTVGEVIRALEVGSVILEHCEVDWFITVPVPRGRELLVKACIWKSTAKPPIEIAEGAHVFFAGNILHGTWQEWMLAHAKLLVDLKWDGNIAQP